MPKSEISKAKIREFETGRGQPRKARDSPQSTQNQEPRTIDQRRCDMTVTVVLALRSKACQAIFELWSFFAEKSEISAKPCMPEPHDLSMSVP